MTRYGGLAIVVLSGMLIGCQPKPPTPPPQPPALGYDEIRADLMAANPGAVVGQVGGTYLQYHLILVNSVEPGQLQLGDAVSFLDDRLNSLTIGKVTKIMPDGNIIVRIEAPAPGAREPEAGDVAVHIPPGAMLNTATPPPTTSTVPGPTTMPAALPPDMTNPTPPAAPPASASQPAEMSPAPAATEPATAPAAAPETSAPPAAPPMTQPELNK